MIYLSAKTALSKSLVVKIKFFVPENRSKNVFRYFHSIVVLAEGFTALGYEIYGNIDYWYEPLQKGFVISRAPEGFKQDVNIFIGAYFKEGELTKSDAVNVLMDMGDGMFTHFNDPRFSKFDLIFKAHYNLNYEYPYNVRPWAFGLSNRIINTIDQVRGGVVKDKLLVNFRGGHTLRKLVISNFHPLLNDKYPIDDSTEPKIEVPDIESITEVDDQQLSYLYQTKHRHNPNYFKRLNEARLTSVFGGFIMRKPIREHKSRFPFLQLYKRQVLIPGLNINAQKYFIYQYDSWRLWESLYASTIPIHLDLEEWGATLPLMPVNGEHYIGVKNFDFKACSEYIKGLSEAELVAISEAGTQWVKENYSPANTAQYLLSEVEKIKKRD